MASPSTPIDPVPPADSVDHADLVPKVMSQSSLSLSLSLNVDMGDDDDGDKNGELKRCLVDTFHRTDLGFGVSAEVRAKKAKQWLKARRRKRRKYQCSLF
ncbi:hypothetical protein LguiB_000115 [Lonicera macranthoides]